MRGDKNSAADVVVSAAAIMNDDIVKIVEDNEHLGLIVSGTQEELKNTDKNINSARKILSACLEMSSHTGASSPQLSYSMSGPSMSVLC